MITIGRLLYKTYRIRWKAFLVHNVILGLAMSEMFEAWNIAQIHMTVEIFTQDAMFLFHSIFSLMMIFYVIVDSLKIAKSAQTLIIKFFDLCITIVVLYINTDWIAGMPFTSITFMQHMVTAVVVVAIFKIIERITRYDFETNTYVNAVKITKESMGKAKKGKVINE